MPFVLDCDWKSGFVMDPNKKQRVGYLLNLDGLGLDATLAQAGSRNTSAGNAAGAH